MIMSGNKGLLCVLISVILFWLYSCSSTTTFSHAYNIEDFEAAGGILAEEVLKEMPENSNQHPWPGMFGRDANYPAYALYCRHVKNLTLDNITTSLEQPDERPALVLDDVHDARLRFLDFDPAGAKSQVQSLSSTGIRKFQ